MLRNTHSGMTVQAFEVDLQKNLSAQEFPGKEIPLNGAGIITIIKIKNSNELLTPAFGKLNPVTNNFENTLAVGGGFKFLKGGIENTFMTALNAAIQFKAPGLSEVDNNVAPEALVGFCKDWGNMQYATLYRVIEVETKEDAVNLVKKINQTNEEKGKTDRFGLYNLNDVTKSAGLTSPLEENNKTKGDAIERAGLVITNLLNNEEINRFIVFDDLATDALNKLILTNAKKAQMTDAKLVALNFGAFAADTQPEKIVSASISISPRR